MPKEKLKKTLHGLGDEINSVDHVDDVSRVKLEKLSGKVDTYLAEDAPVESDTTHSLIQDLQDAEEHFEVSHPRLTDGINRVLTALSDMGI